MSLPGVTIMRRSSGFCGLVVALNSIRAIDGRRKGGIGDERSNDRADEGDDHAETEGPFCQR